MTDNPETPTSDSLPPPPSGGVTPTVISHSVTTSAGNSSSAARTTVSGAANIIWLVFAGVWFAMAYVLAGFLAFLTIVGIPFGVQSFKLAGYALWPFGRGAIQNPRRDAGLSTLGNVAWFLVGGWWIAILHLVLAVLLAITIIGLPLAAASVKMAGLAIAPFGKQIVPLSSLNSMVNVTIVSSVG